MKALRRIRAIMYLEPINAAMALFGIDKATSGYAINAQKSAARVSLAACSVQRLTKHKGGLPKETYERTMIDIVKLCVNPTIKLPNFYSTNMARVSRVGIEHIDVSALVQEIAALRAEVHSFAAVRAGLADVRTTLGALGSSKQDVVQSSSSVGVVQSVISSPTRVPTGTIPDTASQSSSMLVADASSFASIAKSLDASGINERKNKQKPKSVVGRSTDSSRVKAVVTKRQIDMFVSRTFTY